MIISFFTGGARENVLRTLIEARRQIGRVYVNDPGRWPSITPTIELASEHAIPVSIIGRKSDVFGILPDIEGTICLSAGFRYIFPAEFLEKAGVVLNVHGSLLPKYAGGRTLNWTIANGDIASGVTVHSVDAGVDTGPIILQKSFPLTIFDTPASLMRKTMELEPSVVLEALDIVERNGIGAAWAQAPNTTPRLPDRGPEHSRIDPSLSLAELYNQIRACDPDRYPAFFFVDGQKVCVRLWRPDKPDTEQDLL